MPLAVFSDGRAPWERAADIEDVFVRPANEVGTMKGLIFNRNNRRDLSVRAGAVQPANGPHQREHRRAHGAAG